LVGTTAAVAALVLYVCLTLPPAEPRYAGKKLSYQGVVIVLFALIESLEKVSFAGPWAHVAAACIRHLHI
jgi:hypothetical protein